MFHKKWNWFMCLFVVFHLTRECFTYTETSPLPMRGCKFWHKLGTHGHWAVRVLQRVTPTGTGANRNGNFPRTRVTQTYCRVFRSGGVTTWYYDLGLSQMVFEHPTFRLQGERSNPLLRRRGKTCRNKIWF